MMTPREIFWHNFRTLRRNMRGATNSDWIVMKSIQRNGLLGHFLMVAMHEHS